MPFRPRRLTVDALARAVSMRRAFMMFSMVCCLLAYATAVSGVSFTSSQTGNWSDTATWGGSGPPGDGDDATIASTHVVTVNDARLIGDATANVRLTVASGGTLTIASGGTLTVKSHSSIAGTLTLAGGGAYKFGTLATANNYEMRLVATTVLSFVGTSGSHCTVTSDTTGGGAGRGAILRNATATHTITLTWCDFSYLGSATVIGFDIDPSTDSLSITHCTFDNYGFWRVNSLGTNASLTIEDNTFTNALDTATGNYTAWFTTTAPGTGTRSVQRNWFSPNKTVVIAGSKSGWTWKHNIIGKTLVSGVTSYGAYALNTDNLWYARASALSHAAHTTGDTVTRAYGFLDLQTAGSDIFLEEYISSNNTGTITIDQCIFDATLANENTDVIKTGSQASGTHTWIIQHCIVLPNARGQMSGTISTSHGSNTHVLNLQHNTFLSGHGTGSSTAESAIYVGSGYPGRANYINTLRDNLAWNSSVPSSDGQMIWRTVSSAVTPEGAYSAGSADTGTTTTSLTDAGVLIAFPTGTTPDIRLNTGGAKICYRVGSQNPGICKNVTSTTSGTVIGHDAFDNAPAVGDLYWVNPYDLINTTNNVTNATWNVTDGTVYDSEGLNATTKRGYRNFWMTTPANLGATDITLTSSPNFVDSTRNMATFASVSLGRNCTNGGSYGSSGQGNWADGHGTYNVGDVVCNTNANFYSSTSILYRTITAHDPIGVANDEPGAGTAWRTYWELASLYEIRLDPTQITTLIDWVQAGYAPRNTALHAASDNVTPSNGWIGAMAGSGSVSGFFLQPQY